MKHLLTAAVSYYPYLLLLRYDNRSAAVFACVLRCHYDKIKLGVYARLLVACAKCPKIQAQG
jgi:hypothetical protein